MNDQSLILVNISECAYHLHVGIAVIRLGFGSPARRMSGCSAAGARLLWEQEVAGSIPATPTTLELVGKSIKG